MRAWKRGEVAVITPDLSLANEYWAGVSVEVLRKEFNSNGQLVYKVRRLLNPDPNIPVAEAIPELLLTPEEAVRVSLCL